MAVAAAEHGRHRPESGSRPPRCPARRCDHDTALVFDHLSAETLRLAQKATLDYVPMSGESDVRVGVFATDAGVRVHAAATRPTGAIRQAVSRVLPAGKSDEDQKTERRRSDGHEAPP